MGNLLKSWKAIDCLRNACAKELCDSSLVLCSFYRWYGRIKLDLRRI